jgi:hypothetical protein
MSLQAGLVTFPDQQAIIDYINGHPMKLVSAFDNDHMKSAFPDGNGIQMIAAQFAGKTMKREEINANIETAMANGNEKWKKFFELRGAITQLVSGWKSNAKDSMESAGTKMDEDIKIILAVYESVLVDAVEGTTFTPPPGGPYAPGIWTRHVQKLT